VSYRISSSEGTGTIRYYDASNQSSVNETSLHAHTTIEDVLRRILERREYYLHYVGAGLYTYDMFIREARMFGVARAMPPNVLKGMEWGTPIFLAFNNPEEKSAHVFGYFCITGINHNLPEKLSEIVDRSIAFETAAKHYYVARKCGYYKVRKESKTKLSLAEVVDIIVSVAREHNYPVKIFATGELRLTEPFTLHGVSFTRSVIKVRIWQTEVSKREQDYYIVRSIENYRQNQSISKHAKNVIPIVTFLNEEVVV